MKATKNNCKAAVEIMKVLESNNCTVADVCGVLNYVEAMIRKAATVPKQDYDVLLEKLLTSCDD